MIKFTPVLESRKGVPFSWKVAATPKRPCITVSYTFEIRAGPILHPGYGTSYKLSSPKLSFSLSFSIAPHSRTTMYSTPNELYTAFSFIGFLFCAIPLYWHLESTLGMYSRDLEYLILGMFDTAWNMGTCLYMIWTGLGCLLQCVNSIVWNKNTTNRAPVYCDICKILSCVDSRSYAHRPSPHSNPFSSGT